MENSQKCTLFAPGFRAHFLLRKSIRQSTMSQCYPNKTFLMLTRIFIETSPLYRAFSIHSRNQLFLNLQLESTKTYFSRHFSWYLSMFLWSCGASRLNFGCPEMCHHDVNFDGCHFWHVIRTNNNYGMLCEFNSFQQYFLERDFQTFNFSTKFPRKFTEISP